MGTRAIDPEALLRNAAWVRELAGRLARPGVEAEDLVQDTWLVALRREERVQGELRSWLGGVVRNLARGEARRRARRERAAGGELTPGGALEKGPDPGAGRPARGADELVAEAELQRRLLVRVLTLDEGQREVVLSFRPVDAVTGEPLVPRVLFFTGVGQLDFEDTGDGLVVAADVPSLTGDLVAHMGRHETLVVPRLHLEGGTLDLGEFPLLPCVRLAGRLVDAQGSPYRGFARLYLWPVEGGSLQELRAREDGSFEARGVDPGLYVLRARGEDELSPRAGMNPSLTSEALLVDLTYGSREGVELRMHDAVPLVFRVGSVGAGALSYVLEDGRGLALRSGSVPGAAPRLLLAPPGDYVLRLRDREGPLFRQEVHLERDLVRVRF